MKLKRNNHVKTKITDGQIFGISIIERGMTFRILKITQETNKTKQPNQ